ncbi:hypothetical protein [Arthrobacter globiformis]|uniref:Uncharacterized protein n=1 Tax=Arthrobacter globiformis TaxID=1665 RepID=A0A328HFD7_ARTGO|nr:hypothetical protein [Arthrobacter globiformis]RAM37212.1 hypothetical protein DBZ45_11260 [Arthrobacter globiformis]
MTTVVSAPGDLVVATSDGIDVRFAGMELTESLPAGVKARPGERGIKVRLEGVQGPETQQRDHQFTEAIVDWVEQREKRGAESAGQPPTMPGVLVLEPVQLRISDDFGTEYECVAGQIAGDGTEWSASWMYLPEPPKHVRSINLVFTLHGAPTGKDCQIRLD